MKTYRLSVVSCQWRGKHFAVFLLSSVFPAPARMNLSGWRLRLILLLAGGCLLSSETFAQLTITPSVTNATCPGSRNGSISVSVSGGTSPYTYLWLPDGQTTPDITGLNAGTYSITVTDNVGSSSTDSYEVGPAPFSYPESMTECLVLPASYFTPNGDNINDTWQIANAQYFDNIHLIVFDRWGTRVHEQKGTYEPWDGKSYLFVPVPNAVYYYFFYQDKDDKQKQAKSGSVTIMR